MARFRCSESVGAGTLPRDDAHQAEYLAEELCGIVATHMFVAQAIRQDQGGSISNRKERKERERDIDRLRIFAPKARLAVKHNAT